MAELTCGLEDEHADAPLVSAVIGLSVDPEDEPLGRIDTSLADELGIRGVTGSRSARTDTSASETMAVTPEWCGLTSKRSPPC